MNTQTLTDRLFRPSSSSLLNMLRSFEGVGRPLSRVEPAVQRERYLSTKRLDPLLEVPTEEPICMRGTPRVNHIPDEDEAFEMPFTAEELMESFMEQNSTTTAELMALAPVRQPRVVLTDDFAHQLVTPKCPITYAVTQLRLLEEDVYTLERLNSASVDACLTSNSVKIWGTKLNALVHMQHRKLVETIQRIKTESRVKDFMAALDRMGYANWFDSASNVIHLRSNLHVQYGYISV